MSRFVLIPGAGGEAPYWHRVVPLVEARGHQAAAVDLPGPDPAAGLPEYTEIVLAAVGDDRAPVIVAQSLGHSRRLSSAPERPYGFSCSPMR